MREPSRELISSSGLLTGLLKTAFLTTILFADYENQRCLAHIKVGKSGPHNCTMTSGKMPQPPVNPRVNTLSIHSSYRQALNLSVRASQVRKMATSHQLLRPTTAVRLGIILGLTISR
jgi:hypothetical protein